jgi:hypothetical protein
MKSTAIRGGRRTCGEPNAVRRHSKKEEARNRNGNSSPDSGGCRARGEWEPCRRETTAQRCWSGAGARERTATGGTCLLRRALAGKGNKR